MREVIDFNKNFLTGEVTEVKKYKEDTMYKGTATVQIFNEKGEVIQEAKSTNFIHPGHSSYLYNLYYKNMLLYGSETYQSINKLKPASHMLLTSNTNAENPNNYQIEGDLIGFANGWAPYSGSNSIQGTLNTAETSVSDWSRHIVIDFPTHAANGTFQSIYWTSGIENTSGICINSLVSDKTSSYGHMTIFKNKIYMLNYKNRKSVFIIDKTTGDIIDEKILTFNTTSITASDTHLYIIDTSGKNIYKLDESFNVSQTLSFNKTIYSPDNQSCLKILYSNEGLVILYMPSNGNFEAAVLDISTGTIKRELNFGNVIAGYSNRFYSNALLYKNYIIMSKAPSSANIENRAYCYDIKENKLIYYNTGDNFIYIPHEKYSGAGAPYIITMSSTVDIATNEVYVVENRNYNILKGTLIPYFSHTLLPAPITKTSANTMKIQYDFVVEPRGAFQI